MNATTPVPHASDHRHADTHEGLRINTTMMLEHHAMIKNNERKIVGLLVMVISLACGLLFVWFRQVNSGFETDNLRREARFGFEMADEEVGPQLVISAMEHARIYHTQDGQCHIRFHDWDRLFWQRYVDGSDGISVSTSGRKVVCKPEAIRGRLELVLNQAQLDGELEVRLAPHETNPEPVILRFRLDHKGPIADWHWRLMEEPLE